MHGDGEHFGNRVPFVICFDTATFLEHERFLVMRHTAEAYDARVEAVAILLREQRTPQACEWKEVGEYFRKTWRADAKLALAAIGIRRPRAGNGGIAPK